MTARASDRLTRRTSAGAAWLIAVRLVTKGIDFLALLVLARLLTPADFGVVAIAMTLVYIVEAVLEMPVYQVLVGLPAIERHHLDTAFTLGLVRGVVLATALAAMAVPFAHLYHSERVAGLIAVLGLAPAMRGMMSPRLAEYAAALDFRREGRVELVAKLASFALSTSAAFAFRDYRALIVGILTTPAVMILASYLAAPYRPRLSLAAWPLFGHFLCWTTASQLLSALNWQCDRLFLGRIVTRTELGAFSLANDLSYLPEQALIRPIVRPLISAFALIGDDPERLRAAYAKTAGTILAVGAPVMIGLGLLADPAVRLVLGGKWIAAIPALAWLSLTLIPPLYAAPFASLAIALGRPRAVLHQTMAEAANKLPLVATGALFAGVDGVIVARGISTVVTTAIVVLLVRGLIGTPAWRQLADVWRTAVAGLVLAVVLIVLRPALAGESGVRLAAMLAAVAATGLAAYLATLAAAWHLAGRPHGLEAVAFERIAAMLARRRPVAGPDAA